MNECRICQIETDLFDTVLVLKKYLVRYFLCKKCGCVQTEHPYWLDEAYSEAIAVQDTGVLSRNASSALMLETLLGVLFRATHRFLDFGGGYGILVRTMRDAGFDFYRLDKFCPNLFARGFDACLEPNQYFECVTAFEVFEHLVDVIGTTEKLLRHTDSILFSTFLLPRPTPKVADWWYYTPETGQHVTFYTTMALRALARRFRLNLYSCGATHLLTRKVVPSILFQALVHPRISWLIRSLPGRPHRKSLTHTDYERLSRESRR